MDLTREINKSLVKIGLMRARRGLDIPVVSDAEPIKYWRPTRNGRGYLILVKK